ncbi:hypothetical protein HBI24_151220 [Parastagonospora nodorum]|nr:hypothetical protein HBI24_151220 [Parastagonospora nodorum]
MFILVIGYPLNWLVDYDLNKSPIWYIDNAGPNSDHALLQWRTWKNVLNLGHRYTNSPTCVIASSVDIVANQGEGRVPENVSYCDRKTFMTCRCDKLNGSQAIAPDQVPIACGTSMLNLSPRLANRFRSSFPETFRVNDFVGT